MEPSFVACHERRVAGLLLAGVLRGRFGEAALREELRFMTLRAVVAAALRCPIRHVLAVLNSDHST